METWLQRRVGSFHCIFAALLLFPLLQGGQRDGSSVRLNDNSDWWSVLNKSFQRPKIKSTHVDIAASNFEILGVRLQEHQFRDVTTKLGEASIAERGSSTSRRSQVCYKSPGSPDSVYLVFEQGKSDYYNSHAIYVFRDQRDWTGSDLCVKSEAISSELATTSGLHLGQSALEVQAVLGKPDFVSPDKLIYSRYMTKETPKEELEKIKAQSSMSAKQVESLYGNFGLSIYIEARFAEGRLHYVVISNSESY